MRHETKVLIDADAELVWRVISSIAQWPEWTPTVTEVQRVDEGPLRAGSQAWVRQPGQPRRMWTVTELDPKRSFTWSTGNRLLRLTAGHAVTSSADGATAVELDLVVLGPLEPVSRLFAKKIRGFVDTEARSLKHWCEGRGAVST